MSDPALGIGVQSLPTSISEILVLNWEADAAMDPSQQALVA